MSIKALKLAVVLSATFGLHAPVLMGGEIRDLSVSWGTVIEGRYLWSTIRWEDIKETPKWQVATKKDPPLPISQAMTAAQNALQKYVEVPTDYMTTQVILCRFHETDWWYYEVGFTVRTGSTTHAKNAKRKLARDQGEARPAVEEPAGILVLMSGTTVEPKRVDGSAAETGSAAVDGTGNRD